MTDNAKKFLEAASQNEALKKELMAAKDMDEALKIAKANDFELKAEDFEAAKMDELSEDEMEAVAGGAVNAITSTCSCGKEGSGLTWELECKCNGNGQGFNTTNGGQRCWCVSFMGGGVGGA